VYGASPDERNWAVAAHLSAVVGAWLFLGFVGPLLVLLIRGDRSGFVREHAVEALNFNISVLLYSIVGWILVFVLVGWLVLAAVGLLWLIGTIVATVRAGRGQRYRYPLTIRLVH
jgi:uncharacterized Tic20 family protein